MPEGQKPKASDPQYKAGDGASLGVQILRYARQYDPLLYKWGGKTPATGFDCSGLIQYVYDKFGISLPAPTFSQVTKGQRVDRKDLQIGDLVFTNTYATNSHVGIYAGKDAQGRDLQFSARSAKLPKDQQIGTSVINWAIFSQARRVIPGNDAGNNADSTKPDAVKPGDTASNNGLNLSQVGLFDGVAGAIENFTTQLRNLAFGIPFLVLGLGLIGGGVWVASNGQQKARDAAELGG